MEDRQLMQHPQDQEDDNSTVGDLFIEVLDHEDYLVKYCN